MNHPTGDDRITRLTLEERVAMEERLMAKRRRGEIKTIPQIADGQSALRLSFAQERLWFLEQLEPGTPVYNVPWAVRLLGQLNEVALQQALSTLLIRHEVLRTTYEVDDGIPYQVIREPVPVPIEAVDLCRAPAEEREAEVRACLLDRARVPFDLAADAMLRATLIRLSDKERVLLLVMHHIASDGWSQHVLARDLSQTYNELAAGRKPDLPELPIRYADFAQWQRQTLRGERLEEEVQYWTSRLADLRPALDLPTDRVRGPSPEYGAASVPVALTPELTVQLKRLALREHGTPFMVLLAGWMILLHRYTHEDDIAVGTPIAGRIHPDTESLVGFFVNTLVLRERMSGRSTFREALRQIRRTCLEAYEHQELPFETLVAKLNPERQRSQSPLFQVMFAFQNAPRTTLAFESIEARPMHVDLETTKFDLRLELSERSEGIGGTLTYRAQIFDRWRIEQLARHFVTLLKGIADRPDILISKAPLLEATERRQLVHMQTGPHMQVPPLCAHQAFEEQARRTPRAEAVRFGGHVLEYEELDGRADRLARALRQHGVVNGDSVGLCVDPSESAVVGILGILKAGAAYVPLDPGCPNERLRYMTADANLRVLVTDRRGAAATCDHGKPMLNLDTDDVLRTDPPPSELPSLGRPSDLAYILYTSGSTGTPKGVAIEHRSVMNYICSMGNWLPLPAGASFGWVQPLSADTSVTTLFGALLSGGCVHVIPRDSIADPDYLASYGRQHRIDVLKIAPTHLSALLQAAADPRGLLPRQCLILGGEPLPWSLVRRIREVAPDIMLFNHYGPTETTVGVTVFRVEPAGGAQHEGTVPIGGPLPNVRTHVLDASKQLCPMGVLGELWIGGDCLAREYVNQAEMTKSRFVRDPMTANSNARLYRSGDTVYLRPDGTLQFVGRVDGQVKVRGFRVETGESESALLELPEVHDAAVIARHSQEGDTQLVAYVVPCQGRSVEPESLRSILAAKLPSPMIPQHFVLVAALPRTPHGKLDINGLPDPYEVVSVPTAERESPVGELETHLAVFWETLLGRSCIGRHDNFFELGGHSLLAVRLISRILQTLNIRIPVRVVFERPTIKGLAEYVLERLVSADEDLPDPAIHNPGAASGRAREVDDG